MSTNNISNNMFDRFVNQSNTSFSTPNSSKEEDDSSYHTPTTPMASNTYFRNQTPYQRVQFDSDEESSPVSEVIENGKNYGTPAQVKDRVRELRTQVQLQTPRAIKPNAILEVDLKSEVDDLYKALVAFMFIPDSEAMKLQSEERAVIRFMIDLFASNMTRIETDYSKYEVLYDEIASRLMEKAFTDYFPPVKV